MTPKYFFIGSASSNSKKKLGGTKIVYSQEEKVIRNLKVGVKIIV